MNVTLTPAILRIRLDEAFQLCSGLAPQPEDGEAPPDFQHRVIRALQESCRTVPLSGVRADALPDGALMAFADQLATQITNHVTRSEGPLRMVRTIDPENGRRMTKFFGDPDETWRVFRGKVSLVRFPRDAGRGANAPGVAKPIAVLYSDGSTSPAR